MRIGIHMGYSSADQVAEQCRASGVNEIFLSAASVPGFEERGHLTPEHFKPIAEQLQERDIRISGMILPVPSREAVLGQHETERADLCQTIRAAGQCGIDTALFYPLDRLLHFHEYHPGRPLMVMPGDDDDLAVVADEVLCRVVG